MPAFEFPKRFCSGLEPRATGTADFPQEQQFLDTVKFLEASRLNVASKRRMGCAPPTIVRFVGKTTSAANPSRRQTEQITKVSSDHNSGSERPLFCLSNRRHLMQSRLWIREREHAVTRRHSIGIG